MMFTKFFGKKQRKIFTSKAEYIKTLENDAAYFRKLADDRLKTIEELSITQKK